MAWEVFEGVLVAPLVWKYIQYGRVENVKVKKKNRFKMNCLISFHGLQNFKMQVQHNKVGVCLLFVMLMDGTLAQNRSDLVLLGYN